MKYRYESIGKEKSKFTPFEVTITVKTIKDAIRFHDRLAIHIPNNPHEFIGEAYRRSKGAKGTIKGEIT